MSEELFVALVLTRLLKPVWLEEKFFPSKLGGTELEKILKNGNPDKWNSVLDVAIEHILSLIKEK